jgi:hypothetical protein
VRLPSPRFLIGLVLVIVACVVVVVLVTRRGDEGGDEQAPPVAIDCLGGSEKTELMADADVKRILNDKYHLTVSFQPLGSYDQVQLSTDDLKARSTDCLWPASASAQSVFEAQHAGAFPGYRAETVLQSPEVIFAGQNGTEALIKKGIVEKRDNGYYIVDVKGLLLDYVLKRQTWESIGTAKLRGPIAVASTDAAKSNSGFTMAQLELNIISTNDVYSAPSAQQAKAALPTVRALYDAQGLQARSSDFGFSQWLLQGGELHAPLYAGYENQIVQYMRTAGQSNASLKENVRVLYPEPTIYNDHPILALTPEAGRLIDAMKDTEIQKLAWTKYGFRSGTQVGLNDVADVPDVLLAKEIRTTKPPSAEVTLMLLACVKDATKCA